MPKPIAKIQFKDGENQLEVATVWLATRKDGTPVSANGSRVLGTVRLGAKAYRDRPEVKTAMKVVPSEGDAVTLKGEKGEGFLNLWIDLDAIREAAGDLDEEEDF